MILSMTGYGKTESQFRGKTLICEIRSLNSKSMDISVRLMPSLRAHELDLRNIIAKRLERGKVDLAIYIQDSNALSQTPDIPSFTPVNWEAVRYYTDQYKAHQDIFDPAKRELTVPPEIAAAILRLPDVLKIQEDTTDITDSEWEKLLNSLNEAINAFIAFRTQEGAALRKMFDQKLAAIEELLAQVEPFEKGRVAKIKERLEQNLATLSDQTQAKIDRNRLEQEMIYYLEKLDITEEKVRLANHIRYFRETMEGEGNGVGKKLGFIAQEMGREINTLGSKSNQSEMQIIVVKMKDLLEQIKEQVLNVL